MLCRIILILTLIFFSNSCSKKDAEVLNNNKNDPYELYNEGYEAFEKGDYFYAEKKFSEAELSFEKEELSLLTLTLEAERKKAIETLELLASSKALQKSLNEKNDQLLLSKNSVDKDLDNLLSVNT